MNDEKGSHGERKRISAEQNYRVFCLKRLRKKTYKKTGRGLPIKTSLDVSKGVGQKRTEDIKSGNNHKRA